jgi:hypothetical protein
MASAKVLFCVLRSVKKEERSSPLSPALCGSLHFTKTLLKTSEPRARKANFALDARSTKKFF